MVITFRQRKLQRVVNDTRKLEATYGARMAKLIQRRLLVLEAADNLSQIPPRGPLRLVFVPNHEPVPTTHDGGIDRTRVTDITVIGILDTHQ